MPIFNQCLLNPSICTFSCSPKLTLFNTQSLASGEPSHSLLSQNEPPFCSTRLGWISDLIVALIHHRCNLSSLGTVCSLVFNNLCFVSKQGWTYLIQREAGEGWNHVFYTKSSMKRLQQTNNRRFLLHSGGVTLPSTLIVYLCLDGQWLHVRTVLIAVYHCDKNVPLKRYFSCFTHATHGLSAFIFKKLS